MVELTLSALKHERQQISWLSYSCRSRRGLSSLVRGKECEVRLSCITGTTDFEGIQSSKSSHISLAMSDRSDFEEPLPILPLHLHHPTPISESIRSLVPPLSSYPSLSNSHSSSLVTSFSDRSYHGCHFAPISSQDISNPPVNTFAPGSPRSTRKNGLYRLRQKNL